MVTTTTGLATSFITFTRTSNATVTDSNGFIKWAGHNFLLASEQFDAATWFNGDTTVSANSTAAPNGTLTADKIVETATTAQHFLFASYDSSLIGVPYTWGIWLKGAERTSIQLELADFATGDVRVTVNLSAGTIGTPTASGNFTSGGATISNAGSGWYYVTLTSIKTAGANVSTIPLIRLGTGSYLGVAGSGIFAWGAHLYRSDLGGMVLNPARGDAYYPTTPRNLLGFTEAFSDAYWFKNSAAITANIATAPNGLQTADLLLASSGTAVRPYAAPFNAITGVLSTPLVASIYAKQGTARYLQIWNAAGATSWHVNFDLQTGTKGSENNCTGAIQSVGDGWYRCSVAYSPSLASNINMTFQIVTSSTSARAEQWNPVGTESIYLWGAQLSDSASLDAYSPVYGAAVTSAAYYAPRLDYSGSSLAALGLLVEEQRTNLATYSEAFDDAVWAGATAGIASRTANTTAAPTGTSVADTITANNALAAHYIGRSVTWTAAVHTVSVFLKYSTQQFVQLNMWDGTTARFANFDIQNGVDGTTSNATSTITSFGNGWYRCTMTGSAAQAAASGNWVICFANSNSASATPTYTTAGTEAFFVYGAQIEAGSFATSYIPTGASTATRTADVASVSTQAFPYSATEGTLVGEVRGLLSSTIFQVPLVNFGDTNNRIELRAVGNPFTYNRCVVVTSGSPVVDINATGLPSSASATRKVGFAFKLNDFATVGNGGTVVTTASGTIPSVSVMNIGTAPYDASLKTNGWIARITYIPRRISNTELQARTA